MKVGAICSREVVIVHRDDDLIEAARLMRDYHVGCLVVADETDGGRIPVGVLTDRDIVVGVVARDYEDLPRLAAGDLMTEQLLDAREDDDLEPVIERMRQAGVRRVPVVAADGRLVGVLSLDDVLDLLATDLSQVAALVAREQQRERDLRA